MNTTYPKTSERLATAEPSTQHNTPVGSPAARSNGDGALNVTLNEALSAILKPSEDSSAWRHDVLAALESISRTTQTHAEQIQSITRLLAEWMATQEASAALRLDVARWESELSQLVRGAAVQAHNLEQLRLLGEGLARNFEQLSQDIIVRQTMDPFFIALAHLYEAVYSLSGRPTVGEEELQPIRQRIRGVLEDYNVELIHPDDGERVDPRRHQPVKQLQCTNAAYHGHIASTFTVGLIQGQRLIQPARVEVFILADATSADPKPS